MIDDHSQNARGFEMACQISTKYKNIRVYRNNKNIGLAATSNKALSLAKSKYIIRIDWDDWFTITFDTIRTMLREIKERDLDVLYPSNYFGNYDQGWSVQPPEENHHPGGAMFSTKALNHLKFTDKLRGYDGLDLFLRAKDQLRIGYIAKPMFYYFQRENSMSRTNLEERQKIKEDILSRHANSRKEVSVSRPDETQSKV